ncbi:MAG: hypothetical protein AB8G95_02405 [Anaerolineae bacterium]
MNYKLNLDQASQQILEEEAAGGDETIWWAGKPNPMSIAKSKFQISQLLFAVVFVGIAIFIFNRFIEFSSNFSSGPFNEGIPTLFPYFFGAIFLFVVLNALRTFLNPLWELIGAFFTVYAITNQRALIIQRLPRKSVTSYQPKDFDEIKRVGNDKIGDVFFSKQTATRAQSNSISFGRGSSVGDINFGRNSGPRIHIPLGSGSTSRVFRGGFIGVSNPRDVEDMLMSLAKNSD